MSLDTLERPDLTAGAQPDGMSLSPYTAEEEQFRRTVRLFLDRELDANLSQFQADEDVPRSFWKKAAQAGLIGPTVPLEYGGGGADPICYVVYAHELGRSLGYATVGNAPAGDLLSEILVEGGTEAQKRQWLPGIMAGETLQAFPLTEPEAGSDATAIRTTALRDGDHYVINGEKTFISNGSRADLLYLVAKTDPSRRGSGMSMILVPADTSGVSRRRLKAMGLKALDVSELRFDDVRVPVGNLLGTEGGAMPLILSTFKYDRLVIAAHALGQAELTLRLTLDYVKQRKAFGQRVFDFQNTQFTLAGAKADVEAGRALLDQGVRLGRAGLLTPDYGSVVKLWVTEMLGRVVDACLQLYGGAGFIDEMPISRIYTAARVQRLYGGSSEIQKVTIARSL